MADEETASEDTFGTGPSGFTPAQEALIERLVFRVWSHLEPRLKKQIDEKIQVNCLKCATKDRVTGLCAEVHGGWRTLVTVGSLAVGLAGFAVAIIEIAKHWK